MYVLQALYSVPDPQPNVRFLDFGGSTYTSNTSARAARSLHGCMCSFFDPGVSRLVLWYRSITLSNNHSSNASYSHGIFRLTDPPGLQTVLNCVSKETFHTHPELPIYTV